jgi:hypothetical protein
MSARHAVRVIGLLAMILIVSARSARAELVSWDHAKVTALGKELVQATDALYDTLRKHPAPSVGSIGSDSYYRLKQFVHLLHIVSHEFARSLEKGEGREETIIIYENLMQLTRSARDEAGRVFVARDVGEKASAVRRVLNQLGPYYDPDRPTIPPHPNIEPGVNR